MLGPSKLSAKSGTSALQHIALSYRVCIGDVIRVRLIRPDENGEKEFVVGLVGYDKDKILCQKLDEDMNGVENVEFKLADCAYVKLNDDADLF